MKIQSLSIAVPASCPNKCKFCVAHMRTEEYKNQLEENFRFTKLYKEDFKKRLMFARDNGCNTVILTGNGEPLMNRRFLDNFGEWNQNLESPFRWVELQTSGVLLDDAYLRFLRDNVGVTTISLSLSSMFHSHINAEYNQTPEKLQFDIDTLCKEIKRYDFILRLSLNMTDEYNYLPVSNIFNGAKNLGANQITFREFYCSALNTPEDEWIKKHKCSNDKMEEIKEYIRAFGTPLEVLPFGATRYSVAGMSVVVDSDCMSQEVKDSFKYLVLRPDCHLYSRWEDPGSIIF